MIHFSGKNFLGNFIVLSFLICFPLLLLLKLTTIPRENIKVSIILLSIITYAILLTLRKFHHYHQKDILHYITPVWLFWVLISLVILEFFHLKYLPIYFICSSILLLAYLLLSNFFVQHQQTTFAYIPVGRANDLPTQIPFVNWVRLDKPILTSKVDAIIIDAHSDNLSNEYKEFILEKTLQGVPIYHYQQVFELLTGRAQIQYIYESDLRSLIPSKHYIMIKSFFERLLVLSSLPLIIPIMLVTSLLIKLESPGKALFTQCRVGQGGKEFTIYKFRSMYVNSEEQGAQMAHQNDVRITRIGRFIRKTRIDELPQLFNVLKGEMSLIGPRPEQKVFVEQFEKNIPFYNHRHIVKPGITGWAQVNQGYAGNEDETKIKLEYDIFYIKHFSFSLDLLIFFKTIKTMLTGFGAR